jgi:hypothetical protein
LLSADACRRKAQLCETLAVHARSADDRQRLLRMRDACTALAANKDCLNDQPPPPPARSNALAALRQGYG